MRSHPARRPPRSPPRSAFCRRSPATGAARTGSASRGPPTTHAASSGRPARTARRRRRSAHRSESAAVTRLPATVVASVASAGLVTRTMAAAAGERSVMPAPTAMSVATVSAAEKREPRPILRQRCCRMSRRAVRAGCMTPRERARTIVAVPVARTVRPVRPVSRFPVASSTPAARDAAVWQLGRVPARTTALAKSVAPVNARRGSARSTVPGRAARVGASAARAAASASAAKGRTAATETAVSSSATRGCPAVRRQTVEPSAAPRKPAAARSPSCRPSP
jgi:hypothetical protein